jgi:copper-containing nitrite reductase
MMASRGLVSRGSSHHLLLDTNLLFKGTRSCAFSSTPSFYQAEQSKQNEESKSKTEWQKIIGVGFVAGLSGAWLMWFLRDRYHFAPYVEHAPTSAMSGIVAETTGDVAHHERRVAIESLPVVNDPVLYMSKAPLVPPPVSRKHPARLIVDLQSTVKRSKLSLTEDYEFWTFNDTVPGPFIRCRVGDVLEIHHNNIDMYGIGHNIDFHAVTGPGGGAPVLNAEQNETKVGWFRMLQPGLYIYHCAAAPVPVHIANGMYGLVLVEPEDGLPRVDKEFYVMQSEFYTEPSSDPKLLDFSYQLGLDEKPTHVVFNGREGALTENPLITDQGDRVRLYVGNAGPNLISSFHIIGSLFDRVYREGDLNSAPSRGLQTTMIPAGGATVVEFDAIVPGNYTLVDHSIFRIEKGAIGFLKVRGSDRKDIYGSNDTPTPCPNCKLHN